MPPKKAAAGGASKKTEAKKKDKIIEVRLGLKISTIQCETEQCLSAYFSSLNLQQFDLVSLQDKTFGLKNKKGAKTQKFIQQVEKQVKSGGQHPLNAANPKKDEKEKKLQEQKELLSLFRYFGDASVVMTDPHTHISFIMQY